MKRLCVVVVLTVTLIGNAGQGFSEELQITESASDWLKAAKLPSHELKEGISLLTEGEQLDLLTAFYYVAGYKHGIFTAE